MNVKLQNTKKKVKENNLRILTQLFILDKKKIMYNVLRQVLSVWYNVGLYPDRQGAVTKG